MRRIIASLDIGSSTIKLIVGEYIKNSLNILCVSEIPSRGIKKGLIVSKEELIPVLKEAFHKSEEILGLPIKEVVLGVPAYFTESVISEGVCPINNPDGIVTYPDLVKAMHNASLNNLAEDVEIISIIPTRYKLDEEVVKNPINMFGKKLTIKAVLITVPKNNINSLKKALEIIGVKVADIVATPLADFATHKFKEANNSISAVIDIGADTTTVSIFNKGILMKSEVIELGGVNIDNDIAYIYKITKKEAHELKENLGLACSELASNNEKSSLTDRLGDSIVINQVELSKIIESRLVEILELTKKQMNLLTHKNIDYIIITGGTSELRDFNILLDKVFTKPHILGKIEIVGARSNKFATGIGIIKYYNSRLKLKNKDYCLFNTEELETLSGAHKRVNINENSILGKLFGYFFDN